MKKIKKNVDVYKIAIPILLSLISALLLIIGFFIREIYFQSKAVKNEVTEIKIDWNIYKNINQYKTKIIDTTLFDHEKRITYNEKDIELLTKN